MEVGKIPDMLAHNIIDTVKDSMKYFQKSGLISFAPGDITDGVKAHNSISTILCHDDRLSPLGLLSSELCFKSNLSRLQVTDLRVPAIVTVHIDNVE